MMNFKRILVAINHSPLSSTVFDQALSLAQHEQANLMVIHCIVDTAGFDPPIESGATFGLYPTDAGLSQLIHSDTVQLQIRQAEAWL